jgi:uncharacterized protein
MTWMLTATGATVDLAFIASDAIDVLDIAHHLSQINRYTGAACRPMSVAEHSLLVVEIMQREMSIHSPTALLAGLMHDAHEAYTSDLSTPMKQVVGNAWANVENRVAHAVHRRFGLVAAMTAYRDAIRWADLTALSTERTQLLPPAGPDWAVSSSHPPVTWWKADFSQAFTWQDWRQAFLDRFATLHMASAPAGGHPVDAI